jgi:DUF438 domain-containing protein
MTAVKILNLKELGQEEREKVLFPTLEQLRTGESLQMELRFNPLPLVYTLKTGGEFEIVYLKEGPEEWILELTRRAQPADKREQLKELLRMMRENQLSPAGKEQARELLRFLDAATLGRLEQELVREGISQEQIRTHLCDIHLETLRHSLVAQKIEVGSLHPVHTLMEEHKAILANLNTLGFLMERLGGRGSFAEAGEELAQLPEVARQLMEAESHHRREEEAVFPRLERHGIQEPPAIMKADHIEFRRRKRRLAQLVEQAARPAGQDFLAWRHEVVELGGYLNRELASHIFKEDNILYQMALQAFTREEWEQVKQECDRIGYCCFSPEDLRRVQAVELDMRSVPMLQRQGRIMEAWKALRNGQTLRLINDREPKPLRFLFQATQRGKFEWSYERRGPEGWVVAIRKL